MFHRVITAIHSAINCVSIRRGKLTSAKLITSCHGILSTLAKNNREIRSMFKGG